MVDITRFGEPSKDQESQDGDTQSAGRLSKYLSSDYWLGPTGKEEFSGTEAGVETGLGAAISAVGPKALEYGGKIVKQVPGFYGVPKFIGTGAETLGKALGKIPIERRMTTGGVAGGTASTVEQGTELLGMPRAVSIPASIIAAGFGGKIADLVQKGFSGLPKKEAAALIEKLAGEKGLLQKQLDQIKAKAPSEPQRQFEIDRLNGEISKRDQALSQLKQQPQVAERRAETQMPPAKDVAAMKPVREEVQSQMGARVSAAGEKLATATKKAGEAGEREQQAKLAIEQLDQQMMAKPGMNKGEFGSIIKKIANDIKTRFGAARTEAADYAGVFKRAGKEPTIDTNALSARIKSEIANTGDPAKRAFLETLKAELKTLELPANKKIINLQKAHSVKGYLDRMVAGNQEKDFLVNQDIAVLAKKYKTDLLKEMVKQHPDYGKALSEYRKASRPLDIVEQRTGTTVSNILDENMLSKEAKLADAEVAGAVINKANAGHSVFSRLLQESPGLKDAARLHYTQDLFGREIAPTDAVFANWLRTNENSLRQLNLFEEFKDLRVAKKAAKEAADFANDVVSQLEHDRRVAELVSKTESKRLSGAASRTEEASKGIKTKEEILAGKATEAEKAKQRLTGEKQKAQEDIQKINEQESTRMTAEQATKDKAISELNRAQSDISRGRNPKEVEVNTKTAAKSLYDNGYISLEQYNELADAARKLTGSIAERAAARATLQRIAKYGTYGAVGGGVLGIVGKEIAGAPFSRD